MKSWYVDVPNPAGLGEDNYAWISLRTFYNKAEALTWIRENIGYCDDEGNIRLLMEVDDGDPTAGEELL